MADFKQYIQKVIYSFGKTPKMEDKTLKMTASQIQIQQQAALNKFMTSLGTKGTSRTLDPKGTSRTLDPNLECVNCRERRNAMLHSWEQISGPCPACLDTGVEPLPAVELGADP